MAYGLHSRLKSSPERWMESGLMAHFACLITCRMGLQEAFACFVGYFFRRKAVVDHVQKHEMRWLDASLRVLNGQEGHGIIDMIGFT